MSLALALMLRETPSSGGTVSRIAADQLTSSVPSLLLSRLSNAKFFLWNTTWLCKDQTAILWDDEVGWEFVFVFFTINYLDLAWDHQETVRLIITFSSVA